MYIMILNIENKSKVWLWFRLSSILDLCALGQDLVYYSIEVPEKFDFVTYKISAEYLQTLLYWIDSLEQKGLKLARLGII